MTGMYHAEVVGSLLRPRYLSEARAALNVGRIGSREFRQVEDRAVDQVITLQEGCGLDVISDGELRRFSFLDPLLAEADGVMQRPGAGVTFHGAGGDAWDWPAPTTVTSKLRAQRMLAIEEFRPQRKNIAYPKHLSDIAVSAAC
ncbi:MAG TPA: hypothetical protein VMV92_32290 [Streptosporangiaceae bacterium]|nr:hypothetical protein [Streptosporangiaceae bacterium]